MGSWQRLRYLRPSLRRAEERDMREELESLAAMAEPGELGNLTRAAELQREVWGWTWLEHGLRDVQYAMRTMRKAPAFTATAVLSLALGIGANTAIFSLIDALLLRWLPVHNPQELVQVRFKGTRDFGASVSYAIAGLLDEQKEIFAGAAGFSSWPVNVGPAGSVIRVPAAMVTGAYYETLGLSPAAGRLLARSDDRPGAPLVAVISYGYWERRFLRNPDAVGSALRVNGVPVTVVGVSPPGFAGADVGTVADITMAASSLSDVSPESAPLLGPGNFWLRVLARPSAGVSVAEATARLNAVWPRIADRAVSPAWPAARRSELAATPWEMVPGGTGWTSLRDLFRKPLLILMAVVALVLLIACANVANLLLARAASRQREIAVRLAIGAGRARIVRQLLTESTLLAVSGAALGIGLAWLTSSVLVGILSTGPLQVVFDLTPNGHVLAFTCAVALATGILFGLAPAFQATAAGPAPALKEDSRMGRSRSRMLSSLVSLQVALSLMLLVGAGLFVRTLRNLETLDPGFQREGVLLVDLEARRTALPNQWLDSVRNIPGVVSVSVSTHTPLSGAHWTEPAVPAGQPLPERDNSVFIAARPGYFATLQTPLLAGRDFTAHDAAGAPGVAVINEAYARRHFRGTNPLGRHLTATVRRVRADLEIIGVAKNVSLAELRRPAPPTVYVAYDQLPATGDFPTTVAVRAAGPLAPIALAIRQRLQPAVPNAVLEIHALSAQVESRLVQERLLATLAGAFGVLALILASIGLYGLLAYSVARRTRELGIRMALGARRRGVIAMVVRQAVSLVLIGIALGVPAAVAASRWVKSMLFGLTPTDPATLLGAAAVLAAAALTAAYFPARRAAEVDPMTALRHQ